MFRKINLFLLAIIFCAGIVSCEKEFSAENGGGITGVGTTGGSAKFTLDGAPGLCGPLQVSGNYQAGVTLGPTNTVLISANVTTLGDYTIATNDANGIIFTGAGVFTATGTQVITLTGAGTPIAAGNFNYSAGSAPCSFPITYTAATGGTGSSVFTYTGGSGNCTSPVVAGTYTAGTALTTSNTVKLGVNVSTAGTYSVTTSSANGVTFTGAGTFTATGANTITLTSTNVPTAAGSFNYTPGTNGCVFAITYVASTGGGSGSALYTFIGGTGNCATPGINGTYSQGIALNASNNIMLNVNVTTPGTYTLSTNTANGVTFSATGSFAATGPNSITLTSTDTPSGSGTFNFTPGPSGCSFSVTFQAPTGTPTDFLKATLGGVAYQFNTNLTGSLSNTAGGPSDLSIDGELSSPGTGTDAMSLLFADQTSVIASGTYNAPSITNFSKFGLVDYTDNSGAEWISTSGSIILTLTATKASGTFSGTLTKLDASGNPTTVTKTVTAGSFSVSL